MNSPLLIIGIGNSYRSDDGAGLAVVRRLARKAPSNVVLREMSGEGCALMEAWRGAGNVIVVDAVQSGDADSAPGTIHRFEAHTEKVPSEFFHYSTHAFGLAEAIEMSRALQELPKRLTIFGIEGENYKAGETMSAQVEASVESVLRSLEVEFRPAMSNY